MDDMAHDDTPIFSVEGGTERDGTTPPPQNDHDERSDETLAILITGPIVPGLERLVSRAFDEHPNAKNLWMAVTTYGGNPDVAYTIGRAAQRRFEVRTLAVFGPCKSAGTLIALSATHIVMGEHGELGPLDVQLVKEDELFRRNSGLDITRAIPFVVSSAFSAFEHIFLAVLQRSGGSVTTRTAADLASGLSAQLFTPVMAQLDPLKLGETQRATSIATEYGARLGADPNVVNRLVSGYPSHTFVIDRDEAAELFPNVSAPSKRDAAWARALHQRTGSVLDPADISKIEVLPLSTRQENIDDRDEDRLERNGHFEEKLRHGGGNGADPISDGSVDKGARGEPEKPASGAPSFD